jgi:ATP-dependent Lon protease
MTRCAASWPTTPAKQACATWNARSVDYCARRRPNWPPVNAKRPIVVNTTDVREWLGRPHFYFESADRTSVPGVATGLAVTGAGGDVLFVEASVAEGPEGLTLTGQLGDVMKESAEIAMSYVRSHAEELKIDPNGRSPASDSTSTCPRAPFPRTDPPRASR